MSLPTFTTSHDPDLLSLSKSTICYQRGCLLGDDCDQCDWENLHRVLSRHRMKDDDLVEMIGKQFHENPKSVTTTSAGCIARPGHTRYQENHALLEEIEIFNDANCRKSSRA